MCHNKLLNIYYNKKTSHNCYEIIHYIHCDTQTEQGKPI